MLQCNGNTDAYIVTKDHFSFFKTYGIKQKEGKIGNIHKKEQYAKLP